MNLCKDQKIQNLYRQRNFISDMLSKYEDRAHGFHYCYVGYMYPENLQYFREQGFLIDKITDRKTLSKFKSHHVHVFSIVEGICAIRNDAEPTLLGQVIYKNLFERQLKHIQSQLMQFNEDGNVCVYYAGQIFSETKAFLDAEGFIVSPLDLSFNETIKTRLTPFSIIEPNPNKNIILTVEEIDESIETGITDDENDDECDEDIHFLGKLAAIFGCPVPAPYIDDDDEEEEGCDSKS